VAKRRCPPERWRRLRLADLRALFLWRHRGKVLSHDDDSGIEDLEELLYPISLGRRPKEAMRFEISERAPWVETEIEPFIARILNLPRDIRMPKARTLGKRLRVTNEECQWLGISSTIKPFDMTDEDLAEQKRARHRARMRAKRERVPRRIYEENSLSRRKPWEAEGMTRPTWYRHQRKARETSVCATRDISPAHTCLTKSRTKPNRPRASRGKPLPKPVSTTRPRHPST
jgi:hypothetical protein